MNDYICSEECQRLVDGIHTHALYLLNNSLDNSTKEYYQNMIVLQIEALLENHCSCRDRLLEMLILICNNTELDLYAS